MDNRHLTQKNIETFRTLLESGRLEEMINNREYGPHYALGYLKSGIRILDEQYDIETEYLKAGV
jgi:hypothetical protein